MKISSHGKLRMKERANIDTKNQMPFFTNALRKGKSPNDLKEGPTKQYLLKKQTSKSKAKLYRGYVFIYSKNSKRLYTMYKLPEELIEKEVEQ